MDTGSTVERSVRFEVIYEFQGYEEDPGIYHFKDLPISEVVLSVTYAGNEYRKAIGAKDNMAFVGILTTQLWHHTFVEGFAPAPTLETVGLSG